VKKLLILGAGGHGRVVADVARAVGHWNIIKFIDAKFPELDQSGEWEVVGNDEDLTELVDENTDLAVAIGNNKTRQMLIEKLLDHGYSLPYIAHPTAVISEGANISQGTVIMPLAVVNYGAKIGLGCIVNTHVCVEHDCIIEDGVHLSPGCRLAGEVKVGSCSWIGIGASIIHQIEVASSVVVGAGAVVIQNVKENTTVAGVPARIKKSS